MPPGAHKGNIVTFKADQSLIDALDGIENRSEFIRTALLAAIDNLCPVCRGRGLLTPNQKKHWDTFATDHGIVECGDCHEFHLTCKHDHRPHVHKAQSTAKRGSGTTKGKRK